LRAKGAKTRADLPEALAILISNTRTHKRPLPLTAVAEALANAIAHLERYSVVADRIGLSAKMLRQFAYVNRLAPDVQRLFCDRRLDSVDVAVHLSMFSEEEQPVLAAALVNGEIDASDLRAIVELRRLGTRGTIQTLINRVKRSKTKQEYIAEFVVRGGRRENEVRMAIERYIPPDEIIRVEVDGALGRLVLTKKGKVLLRRAAKKLNTRLSDAIPSILRS
jgi:cell division protein ZapA (FtsZ GTPase activity inhibitor)